MAKPLVWYIGRGHQDGLRLRHRRPVRQERHRRAAVVHSAGCQLRITLGTPVEPLLQMPLDVGETAVGSGLADSPAARVSSSHASFRRPRRRGRSPRAPGLAPTREDPSASGRGPRRSSSTPASPAPDVASSEWPVPPGNPFARPGRPAPGPTGWRGHRVRRKSACSAVPSSATMVTPGSSRRSSASCVQFGREWNSLVERIGRHLGGGGGAICAAPPHRFALHRHRRESRRYRLAEQCLE